MSHLHAHALVAAATTGSFVSQILPFVLMFFVFWLIVLRPMSNQDKERRKRIEALKKGDQVVITGGLIGRLSNLDDPKIAVVEIAERVKVRVLRKEITDTLSEVLKADNKSGKAAPEKTEKVSEKSTDKPAKATDGGKSANPGEASA